MDGIQARAFAMKLSLLGILAVHHFDPVLMPAAVSTTAGDDVLLVFSEHGRQSSLCQVARLFHERHRSEEHTSELQSLMRTSYAVFCLKKKIRNKAIIKT